MYKGETGIVTKLEGKSAYIALHQSNREIKIYSNNLKLKSELD
jgi:ribosomal protein L21E